MDLKSLWVSCCDVSPRLPDHFLSSSILASAPPLWKRPSLTFKPLASISKTKAWQQNCCKPSEQRQSSFQGWNHQLCLPSWFPSNLRSISIHVLFYVPSYLLLFSRSTRVTVKLTRCPVGMWICECVTSSHLGPFLIFFFLEMIRMLAAAA